MHVFILFNSSYLSPAISKKTYFLSQGEGLVKTAAAAYYPIHLQYLCNFDHIMYTVNANKYLLNQTIVHNKSNDRMLANVAI